MVFPEITTKQVFRSIPEGEVEKVAESAWNTAFHSLGNCQITSQRKIGNGRFDALVRYYNDTWNKYVWMLVEYKRASYWKGKDLKHDSICQLLMYLGNIFYDVSLEGTDNFIGIVTASSDHFLFIPREVVCKLMEEFEPIWHKNFRVKPHEAGDNWEISHFVSEHWIEIRDNSINLGRYDDPVRLDEVIKSIYKEWNLQ